MSPRMGLLRGIGGGAGPFDGHASLLNGLILCNQCNDNAGDTTVLDYSGNNYHGVAQRDTNLLFSADTPTNAPGAFLLNGTSDFFTIPNISSHWAGSGDEATLVMWVKLQNAIPAASKTGLCLLSFVAKPATVYPWTTGTIYMGALASGLRYAYTPDGSVDRTAWHMLTVTSTPVGLGYKLYQNLIELGGPFSGFGDIKITLNDVDRTFGRSTHATTQYYFDGYMAACMIWNRVLTTQERTDLYNGGAGLFYS